VVRLLVAVAALVLAGDAVACTCAPVDLVRDLPLADGAFIGAALDRKTSGGSTTWTFRVEQVYKGDINERVVVVTPANGAACGLEVGIEQRVGLLLDLEGDTWRSSLCSQVDPADFLELADIEDNRLPPVNWGGLAVGGLVLAAGAFFLVRRLRGYKRLR